MHNKRKFFQTDLYYSLFFKNCKHDNPKKKLWYVKDLPYIIDRQTFPLSTSRLENSPFSYSNEPLNDFNFKQSSWQILKIPNKF